MSIRQHDFTIERRFRQSPEQTFQAFADQNSAHHFIPADETFNVDVAQE